MISLTFQRGHRARSVRSHGAVTVGVEGVNEIIRFALLGLGVGALYAFASQGLIVIFRGTGVLNFSLGATGIVVPARVKLGLVLAFTVVLVPLVPNSLTPQSPLELFALAGSEIANGLFWGLLLRCFIFALETAGAIAAQSMSLSQLFGGVSADPLPAFGKLWVMGGLAFATIMGLHTQFAAYLLASYDIVPVGRLAAADNVLTLGLEQIGRCFALAFSLAAPMMVASLLYNLTLGFIRKP